jgi:O-acetyl-ADP-ribose deacetylase (regulator of RNase III)
MRAQIRTTQLELLQGDITRQDTAAIVNAANSSLLGGGGVDGAIHRAAGPELLAETRLLGGCPSGEARITKGYRLRARYVIHAVGPIYQSDDPNVPHLLASAYRHSLELARENAIRSIAFPSISTGAYGYPLEEAAPIAIGTVCDFIAQYTAFDLVRFVLFSEPIYTVYADALRKLLRERQDLGVG